MEDMELVPLATFVTILEYSLCLHELMIHFSLSNLGIYLPRTEKREERKEGRNAGRKVGKKEEQTAKLA